MNQHLTGREFATLRDELIKWQDRRITFTQIGITLLIAFVGFMLRDQKTSDIDISNVDRTSWQIVSIFPLLLLSITIYLSIIF